MKIKREFFKHGDEIALFEIGYKSPENGYNYVYNQSTNQVEEIFGFESRAVEGEYCERVETFPGRWYEVDGATIFAKKISYNNVA